MEFPSVTNRSDYEGLRPESFASNLFPAGTDHKPQDTLQLTCRCHAGCQAGSTLKPLPVGRKNRLKPCRTCGIPCNGIFQWHSRKAACFTCMFHVKHLRPLFHGSTLKGHSTASCVLVSPARLPVRSQNPSMEQTALKARHFCPRCTMTANTPLPRPEDVEGYPDNAKAVMVNAVAKSG